MLEKIYLSNCYKSIDDLPIYYWDKICNTGNVFLLRKSGRGLPLRKPFEKHWKKLVDEYISKFGFSENFIHIIDSADRKFPLKDIAVNYPIREIGTAVDLPNGFVIKASLIIRLAQQAISLLQRLLKR